MCNNRRATSMDISEIKVTKLWRCTFITVMFVSMVALPTVVQCRDYNRLPAAPRRLIRSNGDTGDGDDTITFPDDIPDKYLRPYAGANRKTRDRYTKDPDNEVCHNVVNKLNYRNYKK